MFHPFGAGWDGFDGGRLQAGKGVDGASRLLMSGGSSISCDQSGRRFRPARLDTWYASAYMSQLRADEKKEKWEIDQCRAVAEQINNVRGTDYQCWRLRERVP